VLSADVRYLVKALPEAIETLDRLERAEFGVRTDDVERSYSNAVVFGAVSTAMGLLAVGLLVGRSVLNAARSAQSAAEDSRRKDEFLAILAHELRNPLAPILHSVELLRAGGAHADSARDIIARQVRHLARLVDDLLDVSRISRGKLALKRESVDLSAAVRQAVETCQPLADRNRQSITVELLSTDVSLYADQARIVQTIGNLVHNACRYSLPEGHIRVRATTDGSDAVIVVSDSGIGIEAEQLTRIFDLFTQAPEARSTNSGGLGIGLTLVRRLAQLHGGSITAESDGPGRGSRFTLRLPTHPTPPNKAISTPPEQSRVGSPKIKILIVDDNPDAGETLATLLDIQGHETRVAADGAKGLTEARQFRPDLILLDLGMPGMNGYEVAVQIRADSATRSATIVALTGWGQTADREKTSASGFDAHFVKPCDLDVLNRLIADITAKRGGTLRMPGSSPTDPAQVVAGSVAP
jgi:signal transduction histidine kinase/CheY-like chemotaxis protein